MSSTGNISGGGGEQWAWLGLLKWTLAHQDGTRPSEESPTMMSDEDKAFLEKVMAEGIIDESERMKFILKEFAKAMEYYKNNTSREQLPTTEEKEEEPPAPPPDEDDLVDLLQELRDIVEQVDYARGFVNLRGCSYLLGSISAMTTTTEVAATTTPSFVPVVPNGVRNICLGILATLAQNNPPVQKVLLELGAIKILSDIFSLGEGGEVLATPPSTKTKIMQALSAIVRCYDLAEAVFEELPQAPLLMMQGLCSENASLRNKTLFFLGAFLTSDNATPARADKFRHAIAIIADTDSRYLRDDGNNDGDNYYSDAVAIQLRESAVALLRQLLERRFAIALLLQRKQHLASLGIQRIQKLRKAEGEEAELTKTELTQWESFLVHLARAEPPEEEIVDGGGGGGGEKN
jgi:hsp70-interacting protein